MKKETIFFSHSSRDKEAMNYLKNIIDEKTGGILNIFLSSDGESIPFGTNWIHSIEQGLNEAIIMYVFITPNSIKSEWIYFESGYAYSKKVRVIPIGFGVDISALKPPLNLLQGFNLTSYEGLNNIVKIINDECQAKFYEDFQENDFLKLKNYSNFINNQQLWQYVKCFTTSIYSYTTINADSKEKTTIIPDIAQAYEKMKSIIESENGCFDDSALDYFQYYPMQNDVNYNQNSKNFFLYRCLLQSVRIIALFHDVGHPPYSHIIEDVLNDIYKKYSSFRKNNEKIKKLKDCFENYSKNIVVNTIISNNTLPRDKRAALHERIGLSFLESAINDTIPILIRNILNSDIPVDCKIASLIYNTLVVEFSISMLVEKDIFFKSFHKIVDGILDADRLDYITRDSLNSGVDWGKIPYKRLINSAKLVYLCKDDGNNIPKNKRPFIISFPQKETDDIEDLLLTRYKIFARINFHHRCIKTAAALKTSVKMLAEDYLSTSKDENCINSNINLLWTSLGTDAGDRRKRVITWNDSWLISTLHQALVNLSGNDDEKVKALRENLEEILLNKKRHYSFLRVKSFQE